MSAHSRKPISDVVIQRVCSEFLEMPGLRITSRQAERLWGLDEQTCRHLLEFLVDARFLSRQDHGVYRRLTDGQAEYSLVLLNAKVS